MSRGIDGHGGGPTHTGLKAQGVGLRETARRLGMPASSVAKVLKEAQASPASLSSEE